MRVYNAYRKDSKTKSSVFKHVGISAAAAANRVEGMFANQNNCAFNLDYSVSFLDVLGRVINQKSLEHYLADFCEHVRKFAISEYVITSSKPLRLIDLWDDDPIGSAGPGVVAQGQLTSIEQKEVEDLFYPFSSVIHPPHIFKTLPLREIKRIKQKYSGNYIFKDELNKRKERSRAIGEDFGIAQYQEVVWLDFTFKLRKWALGKGYDSFVYSNNKESNGEDNYITLLPEQVRRTQVCLEFQEDKYMSEMPLILKSLIDNCRGQFSGTYYHLLWGQTCPMSFWK